MGVLGSEFDGGRCKQCNARMPGHSQHGMPGPPKHTHCTDFKKSHQLHKSSFLQGLHHFENLRIFGCSSLQLDICTCVSKMSQSYVESPLRGVSVEDPFDKLLDWGALKELLASLPAIRSFRTPLKIDNWVGCIEIRSTSWSSEIHWMTFIPSGADLRRKYGSSLI